jgi:hypothetical protein
MDVKVYDLVPMFNYKSSHHGLIQPKKKKYIPSIEDRRAAALVSTAGGRFQCPICKDSFSVNDFGIYGRAGFGTTGFYCQCCAQDVVGFRRVDR